TMIHPDWVHAADLDGDGDADAMVIENGEHALSWHRNNGAGVFGVQQVIATSMTALNIVTSDLDDDGDLDVVTAYSGDSTVVWFQNDGTGGFGASHVIATQPNGATWLAAADLSGDGHPDVIAGRAAQATLSWFENDGSGGFGAEMIISDTLPYVEGVWPADMDEDGDVDLLTSGETDWFENDGSGQFIAQHTMATQPSNSMFPADMDNDGDLDVVMGSDLRLVWLENGWTGLFGVHEIDEDLNYVSSVFSYDLDLDGDMDVVSTDSGDSLLYYLNDGSGGFGARQTIDPASNGPVSVFVADLNGDGYGDVLSAAEIGQEVCWYRGDGIGGFDPERDVDAQTLEVRRIAVVDLNGDGLDDLLAPSEVDYKVSWFAGNGLGGFAMPQDLRESVETPTANAADMDGDGDMDVVTGVLGGTPNIHWMENQGGGVFGTLNPVGYAFKTTHIILEDLDGDQDVDIVCSANDATYPINWFRNLGNGTFSNVLHLTTALDFIRDAAVDDIDNDGDPDIVIGSSYSDSITWFANNGAGVFAPEQLVTEDVDGLGRLQLADMDQDADLDVVFGAGNTTDKFAWCANDGSGVFGPQQLIGTADGAFGVFAADLDGDGDRDLAATATTAGQVLWYENDGLGSFGPAILVGNLSRAYMCHGHDMDQDGDLDLLAASLLGFPDEHSVLIWYENFIDAPYQIQGNLFHDVNENGDPDAGEGPLPWTQVTCSPFVTSPYTTASGAYTVFADSGSYEVTAVTSSSYWELTTDSASYHVSLDQNTPVSTGHDFGFAPNIDTSLVVPVMTVGPQICGQAALLWLSYANEGTLVQDGLVALALDSSYTYIDWEPAPDSVVGQTAWWSFEDLFFFGTATMNVTVLVPTVDAPGEFGQHTVTVYAMDTLGSATGMFSTATEEEILCSYDPNDKQVEPRGTGPFGVVAIDQQWFTYTLRFQNTGTAPANTVMLRDVLSAALDHSSLQVLGFSHPVTSVEMGADGEVIFLFENIQLPDSGADQLGSHGFVKFRVRPITGLPHATEIENTAEIYFDLNQPVITNTTLNTLVDCSLFSAQITMQSVDVLQASAADDYQWFLNGDSIAGADEQFLFLSAAGDYTVSTTSVFGCTTMSDPYVVIGLGMEERSPWNMAVAPNPANTSFMVVCSEKLMSEDVLELVDLNGRVLSRQQGLGANSVRFDGAALAPGLYMVRWSRAGAPRATVRVMMVK
nr:T9SS type A sorting domain-containing protein [Flavobacteriales bacterium]